MVAWFLYRYKSCQVPKLHGRFFEEKHHKIKIFGFTRPYQALPGLTKSSDRSGSVSPPSSDFGAARAVEYWNAGVLELAGPKSRS